MMMKLHGVAVLACCALVAGVASGADWVVDRVSGEGAGPTVLVIGHEDAMGDSGVRACRQIGWWEVDAGEVVLATELQDLNISPNAAGGARFETIGALIDAEAPDWVLVLRDDFDTRASIPSSRGATIEAGSGDLALAQTMAAAVESDAPGADGAWMAVADSDTEGPRVLTVTASSKAERKNGRVALRTRQHRVAVHALLAELGMVGGASSAHVLVPEPDEIVGRSRIAIYDDDGSVSSSGHDPVWIARSMAHIEDMHIELVNAADVRGGVLEQFDAVVFGGGSSRSQGLGLESDGRDAVRSFVEHGGGFVGVCAGAHLACRNRDYALGLLDAVFTSYSGTGVVDLVFAENALGITEHPIKYSGGPLLTPGEGDDLRSRPEALATFVADFPREGKSAIPFEGTPAAMGGWFGSGRVIVFGPHPERAPGPQEYFWQAVREAAEGR